MENIEQENHELRDEVTALKDGMANLTALMESLVAAQNQPPIAQPQQTTNASEGPSVPVFVTQLLFLKTVCLRVTCGECLKIPCQNVIISML